MPDDRTLLNSTSNEADSDYDMDSAEDRESPGGQSSSKRKASSATERRKASKALSSVLGKSKKKKAVKKKDKPSSKSAEANGMQKLMSFAKNLKNKAAPSALTNRCWSWAHWRPVDSTEFGSEPLIGARYDELKKRAENSGKMPQLQCIHCSKVMAWNPSTKRKRHLLVDCKHSPSLSQRTTLELLQTRRSYYKNTP
jgi:hypothetical protein